MRRKIIRVYLPLFVQFFDGYIKSFKSTKKGKLPKDTKIIDIKFNGFENSMDILIESKTFKKIKEGNVLPWHNLEITGIKNK
jgi:hypothetical protein